MDSSQTTHFHQRKQTMVVDASTSNWKTYLIYKWFQLVSSNLKKTKVIAKMEKWQKNWRIFSDSQTAFPDSALSYIQLRDSWCHYSLITNTDIHISFSCGWKSKAKQSKAKQSEEKRKVIRVLGGHFVSSCYASFSTTSWVVEVALHLYTRLHHR